MKKVIIDKTILIEKAFIKYLDTKLLFLEISLISKVLMPRSASITAMKDSDKAKLNFPKFCWVSNLAAYSITANCSTFDTTSAIPR